MVVSDRLGISARYLFLYMFGGLHAPYRDYHAQTAWSIGSIDLAPKVR